MIIKKTKNDNDALKSYYDQIKNTPLLSFEEEQELSQKIQAGDDAARNKLIEANLRLVFKIAKIYKAPDLALPDLIQEGNLGLMKAVEKFDYRKAVRFSTYASWWIKQSIVRSLSNKRRTIRLPHRKEEKLRKINNVTNQLSQSLMRPPEISEIAVKARMTVEEVNMILKIAGNVISLDGDTREDGVSLRDILKDSSFDPNKMLMEKSLKEDTMKVLDKLMERERKILLYRYSFQGDKSTLKSIGDRLGISPETVRQIELRALRKLRKSAADLKEYCYN